jgi:hypothetical protein
MRNAGALDDGPMVLPRDETWLEEVNATIAVKPNLEKRRRSFNPEQEPG